MDALLTSNPDYIVAIHEAAHFVTCIIGYSDVPRGTTPDIVSIISDEDVLGFVRDPSFAIPEQMQGEADKATLERHAIIFLAGYAAEIAYNLTDELSECEDDSSHDFDKAMTCVLNLSSYGEPPSDEQVQLMMDTSWELTVNFLNNVVVRTAIEYVAEKLLDKREISRTSTPSVFDLINDVFELAGFADMRLPAPTL